MIREWRRARFRRSARGALSVRLQDCLRDGDRRDGCDLLRLGDTIQRLLLVEAGHFDRPFDRRAASADLKRHLVGARDRNDAAVDLRGIAGIDFQFLLAGTLALRKRRVVEKRQPDRALDLQCAIAAEKHQRGVGVDPLATLPRRSRSLRENQTPDPASRSRSPRIGGWSRAHGCSTAAPMICPDRNLRQNLVGLPQRERRRLGPDAGLGGDLEELDPVLRVRLATDTNCRSSQSM